MQGEFGESLRDGFHLYEWREEDVDIGLSASRFVDAFYACGREDSDSNVLRYGCFSGAAY